MSDLEDQFKEESFVSKGLIETDAQFYRRKISQMKTRSRRQSEVRLQQEKTTPQDDEETETAKMTAKPVGETAKVRFAPTPMKDKDAAARVEQLRRKYSVAPQTGLVEQRREESVSRHIARVQGPVSRALPTLRSCHHLHQRKNSKEQRLVVDHTNNARQPVAQLPSGVVRPSRAHAARHIPPHLRGNPRVSATSASVAAHATTHSKES